MSQPLLEVQDLTVTFEIKERRATLRAVDGLNLTIGRGQTVGLIGESGAGKSTLGRAIMQLTPASSGRVSFDGIDLTGADRPTRRKLRPRMQAVFQDPNSSFNPRHRLGRSLEEPLVRQQRGDASSRRAAVEAMLERVGIDVAMLDRYPHQVSGGQKQRLSIARALLLQPELVVCDEVVSALDVSLQASVLNLLADIRSQLQLAMLFITHDIGVVSYISDHVAVMYLGQIVEVGPASDVLERPAHPYTAALIRSRPLPLPSYAQVESTPPLQGDIPSPINPPSGCRFVTRCPYAQQRCHDEAPALRTLDDGRAARCHYSDELDLPGAVVDMPGIAGSVDGRVREATTGPVDLPSPASVIHRERK